VVAPSWRTEAWNLGCSDYERLDDVVNAHAEARGDGERDAGARRVGQNKGGGEDGVRSGGGTGRAGGVGDVSGASESDSAGGGGRGGGGGGQRSGSVDHRSIDPLQASSSSPSRRPVSFLMPEASTPGRRTERRVQASVGDASGGDESIDHRADDHGNYCANDGVNLGDGGNVHSQGGGLTLAGRIKLTTRGLSLDLEFCARD